MKQKPPTHVSYVFYFKDAPKMTINLPIKDAEDIIHNINRTLLNKSPIDSNFIVIDGEITFDSSNLLVIRKITKPTESSYLSDSEDDDEEDSDDDVPIIHRPRKQIVKRRDYSKG